MPSINKRGEGGPLRIIESDRATPETHSATRKTRRNLAPRYRILTPIMSRLSRHRLRCKQTSCSIFPSLCARVCMQFLPDEVTKHENLPHRGHPVTPVPVIDPVCGTITGPRRTLSAALSKPATSPDFDLSGYSPEQDGKSSRRRRDRTVTLEVAGPATVGTNDLVSNFSSIPLNLLARN